MAEAFKNGCQQVRMIDFIALLYKKYKVLNRLNENESQHLQAEIVGLLVDQDQNVDRETFEDINAKIGFEAFLLELLGNVINHSPFKNQYELSRNLDTIASSLKKEQEDIQKRLKLVERKEEKLKAAQEQLLSVCKQKVNQLETEALKKIAAKEAEVKKTITALLERVKAKEKIVVEKYEGIKAQRQALLRLAEREQALNEKCKYI